MPQRARAKASGGEKETVKGPSVRNRTDDRSAGQHDAKQRRVGARQRHLTLRHTANKKVKYMLETLAVILVVLWLLGLVSSYTMGGFIHILLVIAVVVILVRFLKGRPL